MSDSKDVAAVPVRGLEEREQLRKHIAAIDGRRPQDGHSERGFSTCPHPDCARFHTPTMADAAEMLWIVLANVSQGDWTKQTPDWQEAAARWRDNYFQAVKAALVPCPAVASPAPVCSGCGEAMQRVEFRCGACGTYTPLPAVRPEPEVSVAPFADLPESETTRRALERWRKS